MDFHSLWIIYTKVVVGMRKQCYHKGLGNKGSQTLAVSPN